MPGHPVDVKIGDEVRYVERFDNKSSESVLSREKARREESWNRLEKAFNEQEKVEGAIFGRVKGGFAVDFGGAVAFLPGSQVDIRPVHDVAHLVNKLEPFLILRMDRKRGKIVVSRRAVLEESHKDQRHELLAMLAEGQIHDGVVRSITDYGAFVDLGGLDGLLHVTDISWTRVNHPSEVLSVGQQLKVQVVHFNRETQRISLGTKQLEANPWEGVELKYPVGSKFKGTVTNITDYGAFVELEPGVEGLVHISQMSFNQKNIHPSKIVSASQEIEVTILEVDPDTRRIGLSMGQLAVDKTDRDRMVEMDMSSISDEEWLTANLIALQKEAVDRSESLDKTLSYVKEKCTMITER